jgi:hypothetical protein
MTFGKRSGAIAAVVTGATLVPLVAFGGVGLAKNGPSASQYPPGASQYKVRICHYTHSKTHPWVIINISKSAWPAHQKHGDVLFPTGTQCPAKAPAAPTASTHGNSGNNGNHGNGNNGHHGKP